MSDVIIWVLDTAPAPLAVFILWLCLFCVSIMVMLAALGLIYVFNLIFG